MTKEDLELTAKYMDDYSKYCQETECGEECPVFREHQMNKVDSCFKIYCRLREAGAIPKPSAISTKPKQEGTRENE